MRKAFFQPVDEAQPVAPSQDGGDQGAREPGADAAPDQDLQRHAPPNYFLHPGYLAPVGEGPLGFNRLIALGDLFRAAGGCLPVLQPVEQINYPLCKANEWVEQAHQPACPPSVHDCGCTPWYEDAVQLLVGLQMLFFGQVIDGVQRENPGEDLR